MPSFLLLIMLTTFFNVSWMRFLNGIFLIALMDFPFGGPDGGLLNDDALRPDSGPDVLRPTDKTFCHFINLYDAIIDLVSIAVSACRTNFLIILVLLCYAFEAKLSHECCHALRLRMDVFLGSLLALMSKKHAYDCGVRGEVICHNCGSGVP